VQVVQLFGHVPDSSKDDQVVTEDILRVAAPLEGCFSVCFNLNPPLVSEVKHPEVIEFLRAVIFASEDVHVTIEN